VWFAKPSLYETSIHYTSPVLPAHKEILLMNKYALILAATVAGFTGAQGEEKWQP
jgi:hypothetical protein